MKQLRILGLGDYRGYYSHFLYGIMEGAIRCGAWFRGVDLFQPLDLVQSQIDFFRPHILLCHMIFNERPHPRTDVFEVLQKTRDRWGTKVFYHSGDARTEPRYQGDVSGIVDFGMLNHGLKDKFSSIWKIPCFQWPYMAFYQEDVVEPVLEYQKPVIFTGALDNNPHHIFRKEFVERLREKIEVVNPEHNTRFETAEVAISADAILGVQMGPEIPGYLDVRPFQYIGSGALYFHDRCEQMDQFFRDKIHYVAYERGSVEDFMEKWMYYKIHQDAGSKIRMQGFGKCQALHDTKTRMEAVIDVYHGREPNLHKDRIANG